MMGTASDASLGAQGRVEEGRKPSLSEIIDAASVQSLIEDFYALTGIPVSLIDVRGNILAGVGWQKVCLDFHRAHPQSCRNCIESDTELSLNVPPGEYVMYKCKNHMWDIATPIVVGDVKVGNLFTGQFFLTDEPFDTELFRAHARQYGFDETSYLNALREVPRFTRAAVEKGMAFLAKLAHMLSLLGFRNAQLASSLDERHALTESLKESGQLLGAAEAMAHVGSWKLEVAGNELSWSDEVYRIFGLYPQGFSATYEAFLESVHPDDRAAVHAAYSDSVRDGRRWYEITHRIVRKATGEVRWVHEKCTHITDDSGSVIRSIGMVQDVTESKHAEEELKRNNRELVAANRAWEEFGFAVSHDLQEPLRTINIYAQVLLRRPGLQDDKDAVRCAEYIHAGVRRMEALLRDLLTYACASDGLEDAAAADLNVCFDTAAEGLHACALEAGARMTRGNLPVVRGPEAQFTQVFQNLLSNALKYRRPGVPPEIAVTSSTDNGECVVSVRDNGIGFEPAYADRIFGLFKRLHREGYPGTGVGLAICRRIVEQYGGRIWAESDGIGSGATFRLALNTAANEHGD